MYEIATLHKIFLTNCFKFTIVQPNFLAYNSASKIHFGLVGMERNDINN